MCMNCYRYLHIYIYMNTFDVCNECLSTCNSAQIYVLMPAYHNCMRANTIFGNRFIPASNTSKSVLNVSFHALFTTQMPATDSSITAIYASTRIIVCNYWSAIRNQAFIPMTNEWTYWYVHELPYVSAYIYILYIYMYIFLFILFFIFLFFVFVWSSVSKAMGLCQEPFVGLCQEPLVGLCQEPLVGLCH